MVMDMFVRCIQNIGMLYKPLDQCDSSTLASAFSSLAADLGSFKKGRWTGLHCPCVDVCLI